MLKHLFHMVPIREWPIFRMIDAMPEEFVFLIIITLSGTIWLLVLNVYLKIDVVFQKLLKKTRRSIWMRHTIFFFVALNYFEILYSGQVMLDWISFYILLLVIIMYEWDSLHEDRLMYMWWSYIFIMFVTISFLLNTFVYPVVIMEVYYTYYDYYQ